MTRGEARTNRNFKWSFCQGRKVSNNWSGGAISGLSGRPWGGSHILNDSFLEDLNSTNVNGKLIKKHALQHGDVITIGHHQLRFADQHAKDIEQDEFETTMVISSGQQITAQLAEAAAAVAAAESAANAATRERFDVRVDIPEETKKPDSEQVSEHQPTSRPEPISHTATVSGIDPGSVPKALPFSKLRVLSGTFACRELDLPKR